MIGLLARRSDENTPESQILLEFRYWNDGMYRNLASAATFRRRELRACAVTCHPLPAFRALGFKPNLKIFVH
jgi:hypothetical protein